MRNTETLRTDRGKKFSLRTIAQANPIGTAIRSAIKELTSVPYIMGNTPKSSLTGFQVAVIRNFRAKLLKGREGLNPNDDRNPS